MKTLAELYLCETGGNESQFRTLLGTQRIGQAFFNSLSVRDQELLRGTKSDPFYENSSSSVEGAIEFLLSRSDS